jgi:hypothetical protein
MAISKNDGTDPGVTSFTNKACISSDGQRGTWSVNCSLYNDYIDSNGSGTARRPERFGTLSISGLTLKDGVTYYFLTD